VPWDQGRPAAAAFLQLGRGIGVRPALLIRLGQPTPPDFVAKAQGPRRLRHRPLDQTVAPVFFPRIGRIGTGQPMLGPLPGDPQPVQREANGFVADQARRKALGETDLGSQLEGPAAGGLGKCPRTLVQQRPEGLASPSVEDG
jgi:hypothetical protein